VHQMSNPQEDCSSVAAQPNTMQPPSSVKKVAIVGTGIIGCGWASLFCAKGYTVVAYTRSEASKAKFLKNLAPTWQMIVQRGFSKDTEGWKKITCILNLAECVADVDYIQESVVEDLALKQQIIQDIDEFAPAHVIIGSSTSFIPLSLLRARAKLHPDRVATVHPSLPHWDAFAEVLGSSEEITTWLATLCGKGDAITTGLGMDVVAMKKECHGHAFNAIFQTVFVVSTVLVRTGVCKAYEMDMALQHFARLVVAGGGLSGLHVGIVGGGTVEAANELTTDIFLGAPVAWGAVGCSWLLPRILAKIAIRILQVLCYPLRFLKGPVSRFVRWLAGPFYERFQKLNPNVAVFHKDVLSTVCALEERSPPLALKGEN
jgi:3-hydroxyacyl-CoA dehydrogenase